MFKDSIVDILEYCWPMIIICSVIIISMRVIDLIINKKKFIFYRELLALAFIIYIMCLFYVVTFQDVSWSSSNFTFFKEMFRYKVGTNLFFKNILGNMIMFVPLGFFTTYFLKLKKPNLILVISIITSFTIEITQLFIGRVFDVDDIILNIIGGLVGFIICYFIRFLKDKLEFLKNNYIYNILIMFIFIIFIMYLGWF